MMEGDQKASRRDSEQKQKRGDPGIEPGTSCTLNKNHTTRPIARLNYILPALQQQDFAASNYKQEQASESIGLDEKATIAKIHKQQQFKFEDSLMSKTSQASTNQFQAISVEERIEPEPQPLKAHHRNYGNMIPVMMDSATQQPKFILGPHFYVFIPTWAISAGILTYILITLIGRAHPLLLAASLLFSILFLYYYAKTGLSHPGIASSMQEPDLMMRSQQRYCVPCRIVRPRGTKHCYYCDVCIYEMDHHCPWVGKCLGRDNIWLFYKFLMAIGCLMACLLVTAITADTKK